MKILFLLITTTIYGCASRGEADYHWEEIEALKICMSGKDLKSAIESCGVYLALSNEEYISLQDCLDKDNIHLKEIRKDHNFSNILFWCEKWEASISYKNGVYPPKIEGVYQVLP